MRLCVILSLSFFLTAASCRHNTPPLEEGTDELVRTTLQGTGGEVTQETINAILENFRRVHFEYDSYALSATSKEALARNAELMQRWRDLELEIQGHADAQGTNEYNLALGSRRAAAVQDYMVALGVSPSRVRVLSYGEEVPLTGGSGESAWAENRRAEFRVLKGGDGQVQGTVSGAR